MQIIERNETFELAYRFVTETSEHIFLTGKAGTGKTTFLKYLKDNCSKNMVVAAPTGVAALNAGGVTLHSLFQLPFQPFLPTAQHKKELIQKIRFNKQRLQLLRKMELLIIDEVSMVRCDVMDALDCILKYVRRNAEPFGGIQLLCIGDLHQLSPVAQSPEWNLLSEYYASPFFFDSLAIKEQVPLLIELNTVYRQKESSFINLLNKVRHNELTSEDLEELHTRYDPFFSPPYGENFITLTSHNKQADGINQNQLNKILAPATEYKAIIEKDFPEQTYPADPNLLLKEGAQVMFLKNDPLKRFYNGKIGIVSSLDENSVSVNCDGIIIEVYPETWEHSRYTLNKTDGRLEQEILGSFTQYPLRLAWAITIHKSQGLTFDKLMIDAGAAFSSGQVYVALSRCTSLSGIVLISKIPATAISSNQHVVKGQQSLTHKGSLVERFEGARQIFTQQLLEGIFSFSDIAVDFDHLLQSFAPFKDKFNKSSVEWMANIKENISTQRNIGLRFLGTVSQLMKEEGIVEKNAVLKKRITDAAVHFIPLLQSLQKDVQNHNLITEHKEAATPVNEHLVQLLTSIHTAQYNLQYCKQDFSVTGYLQHKLQLSLPRFNTSCYASSQETSFTDIENAPLYDSLKRWRDEIVKETGMPIYMVANQASLKEIATYLPLDKQGLQKITGFGKAKVDKYGDELLEIIENYCINLGLDTNIFAKGGALKKERAKKPGKSKVDTSNVSYRMFREGKNIIEIAKERNLTPGTIEGHLTKFIVTGEIDINALVAEERQVLIKEVVKKLGSTSHKTIIEQLPKDYTYGDLRMVLAAMRPEPA